MKQGIFLMCMFCAVGLLAQPDVRKKGNKTDEVKKSNTQVKEDKTLEVVKGVVTDGESKEPIVGASVSVIDKTNGGVVTGTYTDGNGQFSLMLDLSKNLELKISYVGYKVFTTDVSSGKEIAIALSPDVVGIEEVVITALNMQEKKASLGFSVQEVKGVELTQSGESNIVNALNSKIAGIQTISSTGVPGASSKILIRGNSSITGSNQPLFIIDGVPMDNSTNSSGNPLDGRNNQLKGTSQSNRAIDINPEDIESITVLKGPSAAALYGTRAGYGAIVIKTKRGKRNSGLNVDFSDQFEIQQVNRFDPTQKMYAQGTGGVFKPGQSINGTGGNRLSFGPRLDTLKGRMLVPTFDDLNNITGMAPVGVYDNQKDFFQTGLSNTVNVGVSGGNELSSFRLSISNFKNKGVVPTSEFARTTVRLTGDTKLNEKLTISGTVNYINSGGRRVQQGSNTSGVMLGLLRTPPSFNNAGGYEQGDLPRKYAYNYDNPFWTVEKNPFTDNVNRMLGNISASYDVKPWLNLTYRLGTDFYIDRRKQIYDPRSREKEAVGGTIYEENYFYHEMYGDLLLTATRRFSEKFAGTLILGQNFNQRQDQHLYTQGQGLAITGYNNIANASEFYSSESKTKVRSLAGFYDAKLEYADMLYLDLTGRLERSSTFGNNVKPFFFPSASLGFVFTEIGPLKDNKILPFGKLRVAYSSVGHEPLPYRTSNVYVAAAFADGWTDGIIYPYNGTPGFIAQTVASNPNLRPEKVIGTEIGLDLRFFNNRAGIDVTAYKQTTKDAIFDVPMPRSSGYYSITTNAGIITNQGFEIILNGKPIKTEHFTWSIDVNFTKNTNTVTQLTKGVESVTLNGFEGSDARAVANQPFSSLYGASWAKKDGKILVDADGYPIIDPTYKPIGNPNPKFLCGLRNSFQFKGFKFSFLFDFRKGGDVWNGTLGALNYFGTSLQSATREVKDGKLGQLPLEGMTSGTLVRGDSILIKGVKEDGTPNTTKIALDQNWYQGVDNGMTGPAGQFVQDASWIRLREVFFSYTFSNLKLKHLDKLELSFTGRNLMLYTPNYQGIDPETSLAGAGSNALGLNYFNTPNTRSFLFGLRLNLK